VEGLGGLSPKVGGAPVLELCWDAEARGGARDEGAWGGHGVPQGGLEAGDADVEERQGALGSVDLGAVRHPRGEGVAPLDVQACHGPLDTVAEGAHHCHHLTAWDQAFPRHVLLTKTPSSNSNSSSSSSR